MANQLVLRRGEAFGVDSWYIISGGTCYIQRTGAAGAADCPMRSYERLIIDLCEALASLSSARKAVIEECAQAVEASPISHREERPDGYVDVVHGRAYFAAAIRTLGKGGVT